MFTNKLLVSFYLVFCLVSTFFAQNVAPNIEWHKCFGSTGEENVRSGFITKDGGYIFVADIYQPADNGDLAGITPRGSHDIWVVKVSSNLTIQWQKCLGGSKNDEPKVIVPAADGGYLIAARTTSNDGDVVGYHGTNNNRFNGSDLDILLIKLSSRGLIEWSKCVGGTSYDLLTSVVQRKDGGYILVGTTFSNDGDVSCTTPRTWTNWKVNISALGIVETQQCLLPAQGFPQDLVTTTDGGYIIASIVESIDVQLGYGGEEISITKYSPSGNIQWQKYFGGTKDEVPYKIIQTHDGGYAFIGTTSSNDGDVLGNHSRITDDVWVVKLTASGALEWQKCLGGREDDTGLSISQTKDNSYLIVASVKSNDGDVHDFHGFNDGWVVKLSPQGVLLWEKTLGGAGFDFMKNVEEMPDGGYLVIGSAGLDSEISGYRGGHGDVWLVKLSPDTKAIVGQVQKSNAACQPTTPLQYIGNTQVKIEKNNTSYYVSSDSLGLFGIFADTGRFNVSAIPPNQLWTTCPPKSIMISNFGIKDTAIVNPSLFAAIICPFMEVQLTTPFLRRCFESVYTINYANRGTAIQNDATAELTLDSALTFVSATRPIRSRVGNKIIFNLGNVGINQVGQFDVTVNVSCNSRLGQTHCSSVIIPKAMTCDTVQDSIPTIVPQCIAGCDSILFLVSKPNTALNKTFKYQLIADAALVDTGRFVLSNSFNLKRKRDGRTYRFEVRNPTTNQLLVARSVESNPSVSTPSVSTGFVNQFAQSIKQANISENCTANRGAFDPNDKGAVPTGVGTARLIEQGKEIDYLVRFQNTGTDTAFKVVVRDTLATHFNLSTFKLNATSHVATWQLNPKGILIVTFNNINLVDSFTNEKKSHGFFKYTIKLNDSIATNTIVTNKAGIYFDFNDPIITNITSHTIGKELLKNCLIKPTISVNYTGCPSRNIVFTAVVKSAGLNPTYAWYRNNETTPLSINSVFTLNNAVRGTKIYCKTTASSDICTETPVITSDTIVLNCIGVPTTDLSAIVQLFDVFPNPNKGVFTIKLNTIQSEKIQLNILNYLGQTIKSSFINSNNYVEEFNLSNSPNGIYLIQLIINGQSMSKRICVQ